MSEYVEHRPVGQCAVLMEFRLAVACVEGIVVLRMGGGILITLLSALK